MIEIKTDTRHLNILKKAGITTYEKLARVKPKILYDCRTQKDFSPENIGKGVFVIGVLNDIVARDTRSGIKMITASMTKESTGEKFGIIWFNTDFWYNRYQNFINSKFAVFGELKVNDYDNSYQFISPVIFSEFTGKYEGRIIPSYKKYRGMGVDFFEALIDDSMSPAVSSPLDDNELDLLGLSSSYELSRKLHCPENIDEIRDAYRQVDIEELMYLNAKLRTNNGKGTSATHNIITSDKCDEIVSSLPFELTIDQKNVFNTLKNGLIKEHKPINAFVQGDVSCGKSIIAFLLLALYAENGYQGVLLAPTNVLAAQHYRDITDLLSPFGFRIGYAAGGLKASERKKLIKDIAEENIDIVVGTHAVTFPDYKFKNLGIAVVDEEQRFGVTCRESVKYKSKKDITFISMSATPIPRTLASCIYGENTEVYSIKTMPNGRKSVETTVDNIFGVPERLISEVASGRQAYVVCALIDEDESKDDGILSVEETEKIYKKALPDCRIGVLTGNTKESEVNRIMTEYLAGDIDILISTTVIEVGVNNPNSSVIVIQNAERFGLSTLHQLRGRVRRGSYKPYCILISDKSGNERLEAMKSTDDGFLLAEMDLKNRGSGNIIGLQQSGKNHFVELMLAKPQLYEKAIDNVDVIEKDGKLEDFVSFFDEYYKEVV